MSSLWMQRATWLPVMAVVGAGVVSALQVGKAMAALPAVQADLALSLSTASWLLSAFAVVGAVVGAGLGGVIDRYGARRVTLAGLVVQGLASGAGALADNAPALIGMRVVEGLGFLGVVIAAPAWIGSVAPAARLPMAFAAWSTFMPVGMALMLFASPALASLGWRGLWLANAALLLAYAGVLAKVSASPSSARHGVAWRDALRHLPTMARPLRLALLFAAFTAVYFAVFAFLPSVLSDDLHVTGRAASVLTAGAIAVGAVGNLVGGAIIARGVAPLRLVAIAFVLLAVCGVLTFSAFTRGTAAFVACVVFSGVAGVVPAALFSAVPAATPRPELTGLANGLLMQGNNVGMVIGPAVTGALVQDHGWHAASWLIGAVALVAAMLASAAGAERRFNAVDCGQGR